MPNKEIYLLYDYKTDRVAFVEKQAYAKDGGTVALIDENHNIFSLYNPSMFVVYDVEKVRESIKNEFEKQIILIMDLHESLPKIIRINFNSSNSYIVAMRRTFFKLYNEQNN